MKLALICAMAENGVIGRNNALPWHLSEDLQYFKRTTMGKPIIMGRNTWESIGRALPGRANIVVSSQADYEAEGARVCHSLEEALTLADRIAFIDGVNEAFVIGGAALYAEAMPQAHRLHLTRVHAEVEGDTRLEGFDESDWRELSCEEFPASESDTYDYSICVLEKKA